MVSAQKNCQMLARRADFLPSGVRNRIARNLAELAVARPDCAARIQWSPQHAAESVLPAVVAHTLLLGGTNYRSRSTLPKESRGRTEIPYRRAASSVRRRCIL
jgi:hypothetical protein